MKTFTTDNPEQMVELIVALRTIKTEDTFRCNCPNCIAQYLKYLGFNINYDVLHDSNEFKKLMAAYNKEVDEQLKKDRKLMKT